MTSPQTARHGLLLVGFAVAATVMVLTVWLAGNQLRDEEPAPPDVATTSSDIHGPVGIAPATVGEPPVAEEADGGLSSGERQELLDVAEVFLTARIAGDTATIDRVGLGLITAPPQVGTAGTLPEPDDVVVESAWVERRDPAGADVVLLGRLHTRGVGWADRGWRMTLVATTGGWRVTGLGPL